ncbi:MAG: aminotransferase class V-fold PLP-dependent enzyme, partial [Clostridia bacterium]|nr:aminotransferase class V-fold PLP-dependent enzyme [Clostridia bacterium]
GKIPLDMQKVPVDMLSISGHKFHAPKGVGVLFVRRGTKVKPFLVGGHQENARRAGTENVPYIVGLAKACELAQANMENENTILARLRDKLEAGLLASCPDTIVNGDRAHRLPNTLNVSFEYIEGESILFSLDLAGIAVSSGSACSSGSLEPSRTLLAIGVPVGTAHGSIRFTFGKHNTMEEVDYTVDELVKIVKKLRAMSPLYKK